jgi:hypothetical protein
MAQTGNSCSNPYVMNLTNGTGNAEFQFHYPDTVMYVKLIDLIGIEQLKFELDSNTQFGLSKISIKSSNCSGAIISDQNLIILEGKSIGLNVNFENNDTILLILRRSPYNISCNLCDTILNAVNIIINHVQNVPGIHCNQIPYCDNLVLNGSMEYTNPNTIFNFASPWPTTQFDNKVCGFFAGYYYYDPNNPDPNLINYTSPDYYNYIFDGLSGFSNGLNLNSYGINTINSNYPCQSVIPVQGNPFYPIAQGYTNNGYANLGFSQYTELLKATLNPTQTIIQGEQYYFEATIGTGLYTSYGGKIILDVHANQNYPI